MLAIIPARGNSKGIPNKNIKEFAGKPLIAHTILAAKKSKKIDRVIVSTDDKKIADISSQYGAEIPFLRPKRLATDTSLAIDTYLYTINKLIKIDNYEINNFVVLLPTSPLRNYNDIDNAIKLFEEYKADSLISICEAPYPPVWAKKLTTDNIIKNYFNENFSLQNRQSIEKAYIPNGAIYIFNYKILSDKRDYYTDKTYAYIMPIEKSVDIDTILDFQFAEYLFRKNNK